MKIQTTAAISSSRSRDMVSPCLLEPEAFSDFGARRQTRGRLALCFFPFDFVIGALHDFDNEGPPEDKGGRVGVNVGDCDAGQRVPPGFNATLCHFGWMAQRQKYHSYVIVVSLARSPPHPPFSPIVVETPYSSMLHCKSDVFIGILLYQVQAPLG